MHSEQLELSMWSSWGSFWASLRISSWWPSAMQEFFPWWREPLLWGGGAALLNLETCWTWRWGGPDLCKVCRLQTGQQWVRCTTWRTPLHPIHRLCAWPSFLTALACCYFHHHHYYHYYYYYYYYRALPPPLLLLLLLLLLPSTTTTALVVPFPEQ